MSGGHGREFSAVRAATHFGGRFTIAVGHGQEATAFVRGECDADRAAFGVDFQSARGPIGIGGDHLFARSIPKGEITAGTVSTQASRVRTGIIPQVDLATVFRRGGECHNATALVNDFEAFGSHDLRGRLQR